MQSNKMAPDTSIQAVTALLNNYIERVNQTAYEGTLIEKVYYLLGAEKFRDEVYCYKLACMSLLEALAHRNISALVEEVTGEYLYKVLPKLLGSLIMFTEQVDSDKFRAEMHLYQLDQLDVLTEDDVQFMIEDFTEKYSALRIPKIKSNHG